MAKVSLRGISKTYAGGRGRNVAALHDFSLEVEHREVVVLTGPAGCGKSSVLRIIAGLEGVSSGEVLIDDRNVNGVPAKDRDTAMVFQDDALYSHLSVYENMAFGLRRRKFLDAEIKRRVTDAAAALGLEQSLQHKPDALSPSDRRRVALGRAIARRPKVLLLDDPLATLDPPRRAQMRAELAHLHQRLETTIIYATRDPLEALTLGDRIAVMEAGAVQQNDTGRVVYEQPVNLFVARFFGAPPINVLEGTLKLERDSLVFLEANGGTVEARFPLADRAAAQSLVGKPVLLGIRPEDVVAQMSGGEKAADSFPALVDLIEPLGAETYVHLQTGAHRLVARSAVAIDRQDAGRRIRFKMQLEQAHLFDAASMSRLQ